MSIIPFGWFRRRKPTTYRVVINVPRSEAELAEAGRKLARDIQAYERRSGKGAA